jgi:phosphoglycerate dehydrogenase-like enzyme
VADGRLLTPTPGLGGIGSQVAERAAAFGMRILAVDPKDIPYWSAVSYIGSCSRRAAT